MVQTDMESRYDCCLKELRSMIPRDEYRDVLSQDMCELDHDFLGFVDIYKSLSDIIPLDSIIIDFGCNLAAQSYYFLRHKQYIGVDVVDMKRFTPHNAVHYTMSIQDFLQTKVPNLFEQYKKLKLCAICSYVPDFQATEMVRKAFPNVFCYYPG